MRRPARDRQALCLRRVTRAYFGANFNVAVMSRSQGGTDAGQRFLEVLMDIITERFERRDVEHTRFVPEVSGEAITKQLI